MAGSANDFIETYHCLEISGSMISSHLSQCPTECRNDSVSTNKSLDSSSFWMSFLHSNLSVFWNLPASVFILPSLFITVMKGSSFREPISKSMGSCAGVTFSAPVPNSTSTASSAITGITRFVSGKLISLPIFPLNLSSPGFTATPVSPSIVSGLVVATTKKPDPSANGYFMWYKFPSISLYFTSNSDKAVEHRGHQLAIRSPLYINPFS